MANTVKHLRDVIRDQTKIPESWQAKVVVNDDNLTYFVWNEKSREAIVVDPMREDWETLVEIATVELQAYRMIAVIDTHTHADHVSCAARLADELKVPLIQHHLSPCTRVHLRVSRDTALPTGAGLLTLLLTPGHTADCITPIWGPFAFGGDMIMYGDTGRDDLPGGDPALHWESIQKMKLHFQPNTILLPGHDGEGGRASSWQTQLKLTPGLTQDRQTFILDAGAYVGPAPKLLKESLFENLK